MTQHITIHVPEPLIVPIVNILHATEQEAKEELCEKNSSHQKNQTSIALSTSYRKGTQKCRDISKEIDSLHILFIYEAFDSYYKKHGKGLAELYKPCNV